MSNKVKTDPLFLGLTRPPLLFGVSYDFVLLNIMISMLLYINLNNFFYFFMMLPLHALGYYFSAKDPRFIGLFINRNRNCPRVWNFIYHKGNSYDPS
jgi:type IV secretion system protein VirB3